jgi:hypothetical protein
MTEAEWLQSHDPFEMLSWWQESDRCRRVLLAVTVAYLDRVKTIIPEPARRWLAVAHGALGGGVPVGVLETHDGPAVDSLREEANRTEGREQGILHAAADLFGACCFEPMELPESESYLAESAELVRLVHEVYGNPFRPVALDPAWRTSTVTALAGQMYESRDFGAMPILADALQDAGCTNDDILDHCRGTGSHVRGCWVVDSVLGKG